MKVDLRMTRIGLAAAAVAAILLPGDALAVGSFARKYNMTCDTCHEPTAPRLNAFGHKFRKNAFRMENEIENGAKPQAYKEIGEWVGLRLRSGYSAEHFDSKQSASSSGNSYETRNGFNKPDFTVFYSGVLSKNLSTFLEVEWQDQDSIKLVAEAEWLQGTADQNVVLRLGQFHTLSRVGWGGFDRPTGISTPDILGESLTASSVPFKVGNDQRGMDVSFNLPSESRIILGGYNGMNFDGSGEKGNGQGFGDSDGTKDGLAAFEQMFGESGFTLFGYYGNWDQKSGTSVTVGTNKVSLADDDDETLYTFYRLGATASVVVDLLGKSVGSTEVQGGYMFAHDEYPDEYPTGDEEAEGDGYFGYIGQNLPSASAVFYRFDYVDRDSGSNQERSRNTLGLVTTVQQFLKLAAEGFVAQQSSDSYGVKLQAMMNY